MRFDEPRLPADATDAFVDRLPIDWRALKTKARDSHDRALVETLHTLDILRQSAAPTIRARETPARARPIHLIIALAALQTAISFVLAVPSLVGPASSRTASQMLLALSFAAAAAVLAAGAARDTRRLYLMGMLLCSASAFARGALGGQPPLAAAWSRGLWLEVFAPACLCQFALDFPRVRRFAWFDVMARRGAVAVWALSTAAFVLSIAVVAGLVAEPSVAAWLPNHRSNLFWRGYTAAMLLGVLSIFVRSRRAPAAERRKVARLALALTAGGAPFLLLGLSRTLLPAVDRWLLAATPAARFWIDAVVVGALLATPILMSAAIVADRPFDWQRVLTAAWQRVGRKAAIWPARRHRRQLSRALHRLRGARGVRDVSRIAAQAVAAGLDAAIVRVLVPGPALTFADCLGSSVRAPAGAAFVTMLRDSGEPLDLTPGGTLHALLPPAEQEWLAAQSIQIAAAIANGDEAPAAIIVAGNHDGSLQPGRGDLWFLEAIAAAASAAWSAARAGERDDDGGIVSPIAELAFECPACGRVQPAAPLTCACNRPAVLSALPARIGAFVVVKKLGAGGMGVVYLARDTRLDRSVALKTLPAVATPASAGLKLEARAMAALGHDALATIYGLEFWRDVPVLVVEYFPAGTLAHRLSASGPMAPAAVIRLGIALARALECMHGTGLLHGDLKPANVAFTAAGDAKLLDFGLSRLAARDPYDVRRRGPAGTLAYMPPEALRGEPPSVSFDLWSLAVVLLEAVTGHNPFARDTGEATTRGILSADVSGLCAPAAAAHPPLGAFLRRALGPRAARFETARHMQIALEDLARGFRRQVE